MPKKTKSKKWFIAVRGSYIPNSREGWLTYIPYTAYLVLILAVGWHYTDSAVKAILFIVPFWADLFIITVPSKSLSDIKQFVP